MSSSSIVDPEIKEETSTSNNKPCVILFEHQNFARTEAMGTFYNREIAENYLVTRGWIHNEADEKWYKPSKAEFLEDIAVIVPLTPPEKK